MAATLHQHGHGHGGGGGGSSSHGHSHGMLSKLKKKVSRTKLGEKDAYGSATAMCEDGEFKQARERSYTAEDGCSHAHGDNAESSLRVEKENINVRAAFIHVIGDLLQSLGVMVAAIIIYFRVGLIPNTRLCFYA